MKEEVLLNLGMSKNEVKIYLKLLELGPSTAITVAKESEIHRPNVYDILNKLSKEGIISHYDREDVKYYEVANPEQLLTLIRAKEKEVEDIIPQLRVMQLTAKPGSSIGIFEGIVGIRKVLDDIIYNTKKFYVLGATKEVAKDTGEGWINDWHRRRVEKKIWFYHIVNEDYPKHRIKILKQLKYTSIKFLPREYNTPITTLIYDKGIVMVFSQPFISIRILGEDVARTFRNYYLMLDKIAKSKTTQEK